MRKLKEFNEERAKRYKIEKPEFPRKNDIECPHCGEELWDYDGGIMLLSNPPMILCKCLECRFKGYRIA